MTKHHFFLLMLFGVVSCAVPPEQPASTTISTTADTTYTWKKLLDSAEWKKSYNFQLFSFRDTLRIFHPEGAWYSTDGIGWTKSPLPNVLHNLAFLDYVVFKDAIYGLGHLEGNIERFTFQSAIYRTTDLRHWDTLATQSNLPERFFYHPFVFDNQLWIIGGEDKNTRYADIWNSPDGLHWTRQKDSLPFGLRSGSQIVTFKGRLYLLDNDVWSSADGLHWQQETAAILPGETVFGYTAVVLDDRIWLLGCNRNGLFSSQVLVSADGRQWTGLTAPWSPRGGVAAAVHQGRIYMTGGKYGGLPGQPEFRYSNDVWVLGR